MLSGQRARELRDALDLSREKVVRDERLTPAVTTKTLERWEDGTSPLKRWRAEQLAAIYGVSLEAFEPEEAAA